MKQSNDDLKKDLTLLWEKLWSLESKNQDSQFEFEDLNKRIKQLEADCLSQKLELEKLQKLNWESDEIWSRLLKDIDSKTKEISNLIQEIKETWD